MRLEYKKCLNQKKIALHLNKSKMAEEVGCAVATVAPACVSRFTRSESPILKMNLLALCVREKFNKYLFLESLRIMRSYSMLCFSN